MDNRTYYSHSICWGNPYTEPPNGLPRIIIEIQTFERRLDGRIKDKFHAILDRFCKAGIFGFNIGWTHFDDNKPRRRWSAEAKQKNRRKRLLKRLQKKYSIPDLLESAYQEAIALKPDYYG